MKTEREHRQTVVEEVRHELFPDIEFPELEDPRDMSLFTLVDQLALRGYCSHIGEIDAQVIVESDERCQCGHPSFPLGMRRNDGSYRAFAICGEHYCVVFEL